MSDLRENMDTRQLSEFTKSTSDFLANLEGCKYRTWKEMLETGDIQTASVYEKYYRRLLARRIYEYRHYRKPND